MLLPPPDYNDKVRRSDDFCFLLAVVIAAVIIGVIWKVLVK